MKTSPRKRTGIRKRSRSTARPKPVEPSLLPLHWPEALKLLVLLAALWATTLGIFLVIFALGWLFGS